MAKAKKSDDSIHYSITFTKDENDFLTTQALKKGLEPEGYIHESALNKSKKRYKDKLIKQELVAATAHINDAINDVINGSSKETVMKDLNKIQEAYIKLWQL